LYISLRLSAFVFFIYQAINPRLFCTNKGLPSLSNPKIPLVHVSFGYTLISCQFIILSLLVQLFAPHRLYELSAGQKKLALSHASPHNFFVCSRTLLAFHHCVARTFISYFSKSILNTVLSTISIAKQEILVKKIAVQIPKLTKNLVYFFIQK